MVYFLPRGTRGKETLQFIWIYFFPISQFILLKTKKPRRFLQGFWSGASLGDRSEFSWKYAYPKSRMEKHLRTYLTKWNIIYRTYIFYEVSEESGSLTACHESVKKASSRLAGVQEASECRYRFQTLRGRQSILSLEQPPYMRTRKKPAGKCCQQRAPAAAVGVR